MNAKFRMASNGTATCIELDGKTLGTGVESVRFYQNGHGEGKLDISIDLEEFSFMPDGYFDNFEQAIVKERPPEDLLDGRTE